RLLRPPALADPAHQHLGGGLQVDDEVGPGHALREQRVELVVDDQLAVLEVEVGEELALLEGVVADGGLGEEPALEQLLLLAVAGEQEEQLDLEGGAGGAVVEGLEERVLAPFLEHGVGLELLGQALDDRGLAHPDGPLDRHVLELHRRRLRSWSTTCERSGQRRNISAAVRPSTGWRAPGAISASGTSTNRR